MIEQRVAKTREKMREQGVDTLFISEEYNRKYLSGFSGSSGYLLLTDSAQYLLTDFRYIEQATKQAPYYEVIDFYKKGLIETLKDLIEKHQVKILGFEDLSMTVREYDQFSSQLPQVKWQAVGNLVQQIRMIKDQKEIETIAHASSIGDAAFSHILTVLRPGMTEIEVAIELEFFMKKKGASKLSFDTIVASGTRSSLPHAVPTDKVIESGDFVTMDFGCIYQGYCSDMTRTVVVGKASEKQKEIYHLVLQAQLNALAKIKPGIKGKEGDAYARNIIDEAGYRVNFGHGLGHSLGMEVHENPRFSLLSEDLILPGMVMSVEPGIYIPDFGGVRIEDLIVMTEDGLRNFNSSPKELIEI